MNAIIKTPSTVSASDLLGNEDQNVFDSVGNGEITETMIQNVHDHFVSMEVQTKSGRVGQAIIHRFDVQVSELDNDGNVIMVKDSEGNETPKLVSAKRAIGIVKFNGKVYPVNFLKIPKNNQFRASEIVNNAEFVGGGFGFTLYARGSSLVDKFFTNGKNEDRDLSSYMPKVSASATPYTDFNLVYGAWFDAMVADMVATPKPEKTGKAKKATYSKKETPAWLLDDIS